MGSSTVSINDDGTAPAGTTPVDCLLLVMDTASPLELPWRASLAGVDEVIIGRGDQRALRRDGATLHFEVPAAAVSKGHARMERGSEGWTVKDQKSKNGTWVNGERVSRRGLAAGDLLEVGTSLFLIRPGLGDLTSWAGRPGGLRTLSAPLDRAFAMLERVARSAIPLLLLGETGTGKEVTAEAVHRLSRRAGSFTAMNCGGVPETLLASELFGARKGAYSGAHADRIGLVQQADGGTLFLDEIAELPQGAQAVLLRVVQEGEVLALGATRPLVVDTRVVAATNEDLVELVALRKFRKDLYARLAGVTVTLPPLRERIEDVGLLVAEMLPRVARGRQVTFHRAAARALFAHDWPLNIRELCLEHLPATLTTPAGAERAREDLLALVAEHRGNVSAIARAMLTSRAHVRRLAARHGVELEKHRE